MVCGAATNGGRLANKNQTKNQLYYHGDVRGSVERRRGDTNTFLTTRNNITSRRHLSSTVKFDTQSISMNAPRKSISSHRPSQRYKKMLTCRDSRVIPESSPVVPDDDDAEGAPQTPAAATPGTEGGGERPQGLGVRLPPLTTSAGRDGSTTRKEQVCKSLRLP